MNPNTQDNQVNINFYEAEALEARVRRIQKLKNAIKKAPKILCLFGFHAYPECDPSYHGPCVVYCNRCTKPTTVLYK